MAIVRISKQLMQDVNSNIGSMRNNETQAVHKEFDPIVLEEDKAVLLYEAEKIMWGKFVNQQDDVPESWLNDISRVDVHCKLDHVPEIQINYNKGCPCKLGPYQSYINVTLPDDVVPKRVQERYVARNKKLQVVNTKFNAIGSQIENFLKSQPSLNAACIAFPNLRLYIPKQYLDRVDEVVEKVKREKREEQTKEMVATLDDALLTSTAVMHTITRG